MRRQVMQLQWSDPAGKVEQATMTPKDLVTRKDGEYLIATNSLQETFHIRLDRIVFQPAAPHSGPP